ncbi:hypothetical protein D3C78_1754520 [compost metagenome]
MLGKRILHHEGATGAAKDTAAQVVGRLPKNARHADVRLTGDHGGAQVADAANFQQFRQRLFKQ